MLNFDIYYADNTIGLAVHSRILGESLQAAGHSVRTIPVPYVLFLYSEIHNSALYSLPEILPNSHCIFLESIFSHNMLAHYKSSIFISNPECFVERDLEKAKKISWFWHTTRMSQNILQSKFPESMHTYIGFTSPAINPSQPLDYNTFIHFRGKSSHRHTQEILDAWQSHPDWPHLRVQLYGPDCPLALNRWTHSGNISIYMGQMTREAYEKEVAVGGVHLCLSSQEGFGHYINEARSMGALVVTLDAPPMNELITSEYGILIPASSVEPMHMGFSYKASPSDICKGIEKVLALPLNSRIELANKSKLAYHIEKSEFFQRIFEISHNISSINN